MKNKITKKEYLIIVGLLALAHRAYKTITECEQAYGEVVDMKKDPGDYGHFSDAIFNNGDVDTVLKNEGISIIK
jgi:hypothetical protein